jgi:hypothetical protein
LRKILSLLFLSLFYIFFLQGCNKKPEADTNSNVKDSQSSGDKKEFKWKDGVSPEDIPDFPVKGNLNGREVTFQYINFEKWRGSNDNVINFSLVKPAQPCGFIGGFTGFRIINKGNAFNAGTWVKAKFDDDTKTYQAFFTAEGFDKSTASWNCALNIESMDNKTVKGKIALFFNDEKKSWAAGKFEAVICNN